MTTHKVYFTFCSYETCGYTFHIVNKDACEWADNSKEYFFVKDIDLPAVDMDKVMQSGSAYFDKQIAEMQVEMNRLTDQKRQLLALTHQEG